MDQNGSWGDAEPVCALVRRVAPGDMLKDFGLSSGQFGSLCHAAWGVG